MNFQTVNFLQRFHELLALMVILRQVQNIASSLARQSRRHYQQIGAQCFQSRVQILWWQTQTFEPVRDVEGQQHQLKKATLAVQSFVGILPIGKS